MNIENHAPESVATETVEPTETPEPAEERDYAPDGEAWTDYFGWKYGDVYVQTLPGSGHTAEINDQLIFKRGLYQGQLVVSSVEEPPVTWQSHQWLEPLGPLNSERTEFEEARGLPVRYVKNSTRPWAIGDRVRITIIASFRTQDGRPHIVSTTLTGTFPPRRPAVV